ncbi:hypothetical protein CPB86DRAFT_723065 [Serendipita vermifera]|nr:hypothetical protein CPB86DRAFT_723065 [Serendipita vermifera]
MFNADGTGQSPRTGPPVSASVSSFTANSPYEKIILAIINRIKTKLPSNSGTSVSVLEQDEAFNQAVTTLIHLARHRLDHITMTLSEIMDKMHVKDSQVRDTDLQHFQSQLLLAKILASAMQFCWDAHKESQAANNSGDVNSGWIDPPPLDDKVAQYTMSVMVLYMKQSGPWGDRPKASGHIHSDTLYDYESIETHNTLPASTSKTVFMAPPPMHPRNGISSSRRTASIAAMGSLVTPSYASAFPAPSPSKAISFHSPILATTAASANALISKYVNKIIYYISASNWQVVFTRIRTKIHWFASGSEDAHDNTDMKVLSYCAMDRVRLVQLFQELSSLLVSMKRDAQSSIALSLRNAIWNWISVFPDQFAETVISQRKLEGAPERVFETLFQMMHDSSSQNTNRRIIWPTLSALLSISPERLRQSEAAMTGGFSLTNRRAFLPTVSSAMLHKDPKQSDIAMVCYLDLCKAAIYLPSSAEGAALKTIAPDLAHELKNRIMTPTQTFKPFYESQEAIDVNLYADILVAIFRFHPQEAMNKVFPICLGSESDAVKATAVRCFVTLVSDAKNFEAQPSLEPLYGKFSQTLRSIFYGVLRKLEMDPPARTVRPAAKKYGTDFYSDPTLLLLTLLTLYRVDTEFYLHGMEDRSEKEVVKDVITLLSSEQDATIQATVANTFYTLAQRVINMDPDDTRYSIARQHIYRLGLGMLVASAIGAMRSREHFECLRTYFGLINMVFYNLELGFMDHQHVSWSNEGVIQMRMAVASAAFTNLPSSQIDISVSASRALRTLNLKQVPRPVLPATVYARTEAETKARALMEAIGDPKIPVLGRVAFQRRTRRLLRGGVNPNNAQAAGWSDCYDYWTKINQGIVNTVKSSIALTEEQRVEWQNYTLFLASYCGGNFMDKSAYATTPIIFQTLASWFGTAHTPERLRRVTDFEELTKEFIASVVELLVSDNGFVRETAKEALGTESHPFLFPMILLQLDSVITRLSERRYPDWNPANTSVFIDHALSVLKMIFERIETVADAGHISVDLSHIILQLASILHTWPNTVETFRVRIKFCNLCHNIFSKSDFLAVKKNAIVRNSLLDTIHQWVGAAPREWALRDRDPLAKPQADLDFACIQVAATILDRLRLQPLDGSTGADSGPAISRLFSKYLNFFVAALDKVASLEDSLSEQGSAQSRNVNAINKEQGNVRELAILGISNMLSSNMDAGIRHCLSFGYHDDARMRAIFLLIFTRVLRQGARFDGAEIVPAQPRQRKLCEMVRGDMLLALAICETCPVSEIDVMLPVMVNIFDTRSSLLALLKALIDREVTRSESPTNLFRANTMCTRLLGNVAKVQGYNYLRFILDPLINEIRHIMSYELDPNKAQQADIETNLANVKRMAQLFLDAITRSADALPPLCREICAHIADRVSVQWAESKYAAVGGFLFLRFICPAIVSPETVDIPVDPSTKRGLLLITKIIQNLANNVLFGREQFMMVLNPFLEDNIWGVTQFLSEVVTVPEYDFEEGDDWHGPSYDEADSIVLHRFFHHSADKVGKELLSFSRMSNEEEGSQTGKRTWDNLCSTLVELGQPALISPPTKEPSTRHILFMEFMRMHENRSVDSVQDLFVMLSTPSSPHAVFAFPLQRINVETVELDLLITHIFKTLSTCNTPFEVVVDCTGFTASSEIPLVWLKVFLERCPLEFVEGFSRAFILNANNTAIKFLRKLYHISGGLPLAKSTVTVSSVHDLKVYLPDINTNGLQGTAALESERSVVYEVFQQARHGMRLLVSLFVCETHVRIISMRSQNIWPSLDCHTNEIILLSDIGDVYNVATGHDTNEFIVRRSRYGGALYFSSHDRDTIVHAIRLAKSRLQVDNVQAYERTYSSQEMTATLLNISLLNLGAEDDALRSTAYDLACAVARSLNFDDLQTIPVNGGFVPPNPLSLASHISEKLSIHSPNLTLDVITEFARGFHKSSLSHKATCLYYLQPWIKNLSTISDPTGSHPVNAGGRLRDAFRILIDLLIKDEQLAPVIHKTIWAEVAKLEPGAVSVALDELVRTAADGGIGSRRCELMADTMVVITSISVRGKILSKLRKAIGKTNIRPSQSLTTNNSWIEVAAITRLALYVGYNSRIPAHNQLFVAETAHLITLLAGAGPVLMRVTVHGIAVNLIQSLYVSKADDPTVAPKLRQLLSEIHSAETLTNFGLVSHGPVGDYGVPDTVSDTLSVDTLEELTKFLMKALALGAHSSSGSNLINVWRARWMSLVISTAFHYSYIQSRAFVVMGVLATSDVDDDLLYQILVAFKNALATSLESDPATCVGILRCITKVVPGTPRNGRYLTQIVWLAVALMQYGDVGIFAEAANLLRAALETLDEQGAFADIPLSNFFFEARATLDEVTLQIDEFVGLSFETNFSFALSSIIFRGLRHPQTRVQESCSSLFHTLLRLASRNIGSVTGVPRSDRTITGDALGFFLALIPTVPTTASFQDLLREAGAGTIWLDTSARSTDSEDTGAARVPVASLGLHDEEVVFLAVTFLGSMLNSATANPEREMLFSLLADMSDSYPRVIAQIYESIQERVIDAFSNVMNSTILSSVGTIFRTSMGDGGYQTMPSTRMDASASTLGNLDSSGSATQGAGQQQIMYLETLQMRGMLTPHHFTPRTTGNKILHCLIELISRIIE